jgi:hypothetical protein
MKPVLSYRACTLLFLATLIGACDSHTGSIMEPSVVLMQVGPSAPAGLVSVTAGATTVNLWPYTGTDLSGTARDPINLVFTGAADPRNVRSALLSLDGTRTGPLASFDCVWKDAIGGQQATYSDTGGWAGSVIQLECGDFSPFRFHIRLFPAGGWTLANAHVDVLIPGTPDHQVLSWELGEQMVTYDLARSGLLAGAPAQTGNVNAVGSFRTIPPVIYNGLPLSLRALTGGPLTAVSEPVGIPTDGSATVIPLRNAPAAGGTAQEFVISFGQFIPKPFCNSGNEWLRVDGPVRLRQQVDISDTGELTSQTFVDGELVVRSFNPLTNEIGEAFPATVRDHYRALVGGNNWTLLSTREQRLATTAGWFQTLRQRLQLGEHGGVGYNSDESCG